MMAFKKNGIGRLCRDCCRGAVVGALASGGVEAREWFQWNWTSTLQKTARLSANPASSMAAVWRRETVVAYEKSNVASDQVCSPQTRTCVQGELTGSYQFSSCSVTGVLDCQFGGFPIANGTSTTAFESGSVDFGKTCKSELRLCTNGILSEHMTMPHVQ